MALLLKKAYPEIDFEWVCTPTGNESPAWFAHMRKMRELIGPIKPIMLQGGLAGLIEKYNSLPSWRQRWCTRQLKIEPFEAFLLTAGPATFYVGLRADEEEREGGSYRAVPNAIMRFPLREANMTLADVRCFLAKEGIEIPKRTDCMLCFFQRLIEWWELWKTYPEAYEQGEKWEEQTGSTFRSPGRDKHPTSLYALRMKFEAGWIPKDSRDLVSEMRCNVCKVW
jgi:3'-phosphoadenosine 5'-phosphosulfate sulfotransferase (PAPS reductase)/FAD synthetase